MTNTIKSPKGKAWQKVLGWAMLFYLIVFGGFFTHSPGIKLVSFVFGTTALIIGIAFLVSWLIESEKKVWQKVLGWAMLFSFFGGMFIFFTHLLGIELASFVFVATAIIIAITLFAFPK